MKKEYIEKFDQQEVLRLNHEEGLNLKQIAKKFDIPSRRFGEICKMYNLDVKRAFKYKVVDTFFDNIDNEIKAYLLGYFIADGNIQKEAKKRDGQIYSYSYRFSVLNSIDDLEVSKLFQKYIVPNKSLEYSNCQSGVKCHRKSQVIVCWRSYHMFNTMSSYGITPRKTYNNKFELPKDLISEKLYPHFIRGLIDGDGYIHYKTKDKICGGYIELCLNSPLFTLQIMQYFLRYENVTKIKIIKNKGKTCNWWVLKVLGGNKLIKEYYQKCYIDTNANFYLTRKYHNTEVISEITKGSETPQSVGNE